MITSPRNARVAEALRLHKRAFRDEDRRFVVEGAKAVGEALAAGSIEVLFAVDVLDPVAVAARERGVEVLEVHEAVMARLTGTVTPQGLVAVAPFLDVALDALPARPRCVAVLHEVRDPGNAGSVLRAADAAGADGVVFAGSSVDPYNEKAVRASAGSLFHVPVVRGAGAEEAVRLLRARGCAVYAMAADGEVDLWEADLARPVAFLLGNEARGLPADVRTLADASVRVPIRGRAESLNLAGAATVCLFEWARRNR